MIIGAVFGGTTAAVMLVAGFLVTDQVRSSAPVGYEVSSTVALAAPAR